MCSSCPSLTRVVLCQYSLSSISWKSRHSLTFANIVRSNAYHCQSHRGPWWRIMKPKFRKICSFFFLLFLCPKDVFFFITNCCFRQLNTSIFRYHNTPFTSPNQYLIFHIVDDFFFLFFFVSSSCFFDSISFAVRFLIIFQILCRHLKYHSRLGLVSSFFLKM